MCDCEYARQKDSCIFYCAKFKLYGIARLNVCVFSQLEAMWEDRLRRVPPIVKDKASNYL